MCLETPFAGVTAWTGVPRATETTCILNIDMIQSKDVSIMIAGRAEVVKSLDNSEGSC